MPTYRVWLARGEVAASSGQGERHGHAVHVKVDTGMHRVGADPAAAVALAVAAAGDARVRLEGFWTHLAVSDEIDDPYTSEQVARFDETLSCLAQAGVRPPVLHVANSAAAMWHPRTRYDMVRCGIALYGLAPAASGLDRSSGGSDSEGTSQVTSPVIPSASRLVARIWTSGQ